MARRRLHREAGVTLVELLLSLSISSILIGSLSMSLVMALRTVDETGNRFTEAYDAELLAAYFVPDALSATTVGQTIDTGCALQRDGDIVRMTATGVATGYRLEGSELRRWTCDGAGQRTSTVAQQVDDIVAWSTGGHQVAVTLVSLSGHTYSVMGTQRTGSVDLPPPPASGRSPVAVAVGECAGAVCTLTGAGSSDADGAIAAYRWDFGDGSTADVADPEVTHTYAASGSYTVVLTAIDDAGLKGTTSIVLAVAKSNVGPTASFTVDSCNLGVCTVDGSGSSDPDGTIAGYGWTWGDGTPAGSGASLTHTYTGVGAQTITLTVTDSDGATSQTTRTFEPPVLVVTTSVTLSYNANLSWTAPNALAGTTVDVYRNGSIVASGTTDDGAWTRSSSSKTQISGTYKVCERSTPSRCTNSVTVTL